jgi:hypothetical protein
MSAFDRAFARMRNYFHRSTPAERAERQRLRAEHEVLNAKLTTRQVVRRRLVALAFEQVGKDYAMPRKNRRRIARARMRRIWGVRVQTGQVPV